jgi:kynureninase
MMNAPQVSATSLEECLARDRADPLRELRQQFTLPDGVIYLDGNSLGVLPRGTAARISDAVERQWGQGLIRSWNDEGWFELPRRVGDRIAPLIGAGPGEVLAVDGTSINLYKVLCAALDLAAARRSGPLTVLSERNNFPTDLYIAEGACRERGVQLRAVAAHELHSAIDRGVDVLVLTHVNYRTGAMHDMASITRRAQSVGALVIWDLAHSAGAVPVQLTADNADFAIGCGYKYLNGGPGAPGFVWVHPRHVDSALQPLSGWWGHAAPFAFVPHYQAAPGILRYQCGSQPVLSMIALDEGVGTVLAAQPYGGMNALRAKSLALTDLFISQAAQWSDAFGVTVATPRAHGERGSQVSLTCAEGAFEIIQALIARGVVGDFRAGDGAAEPDILRFGFTPLYVGFADVWRAAEQLRQVLESREWRAPQFSLRRAVT